MRKSFLPLVALLISGLCSAEDSKAQLDFTSASVKVSQNGDIQSAGAFEVPIAGGTLMSTKASFTSWGGVNVNYDTIKLEGASSVVLTDGTEMRFQGGTFDQKNSVLTLNDGGSLAVSFASLTGAKVNDPASYSCYQNRLLANGEDTGFSSVCLTNNTRIYCSRGRLGVQTGSYFCQIP